MPTITITISDLPGGSGATVATDSDRPAIGSTRTPAQALAMDLLRTCSSQAKDVRYGLAGMPVIELAYALLDPEQLGHAATPEIRDRARVALGRQPVEFTPGRGY